MSACSGRVAHIATVMASIRFGEVKQLGISETAPTNGRLGEQLAINVGKTCKNVVFTIVMPLFKPSQNFQANTPDSSCCSTFNCRDLYYSPLRQEVFPKLSDLLRDLRDNPLTGPLENVSRTWCFRSDNISHVFCWVSLLAFLTVDALRNG